MATVRHIVKQLLQRTTCYVDTGCKSINVIAEAVSAALIAGSVLLILNQARTSSDGGRRVRTSHSHDLASSPSLFMYLQV